MAGDPKGNGMVSPVGSGEAAHVNTGAQPAPAIAMERITRATSAVRSQEPRWQECLSFLDGQQYVEQSAVDGKLHHLETREGRGSKPRHRVRATRNRFTTAIMREASAVADRVPTYEVMPGTGDQKHVDSARMAEKFLTSAYHAYDVKNVVLDAAVYALTTGAGFAWPFWNADVGDFILGDELADTGGPEVLRTGDIGIHVLNQLEVLWEPGAQFYDSRWHAVRKATPRSELMAKEWFRGGKLSADATSAPHEARRGEEARDLVMVHHYLERPSKKHVKGRWLILAGGQLIAPVQDYPTKGDSCCLVYLPWFNRRHRDRPMGMGELMLDIQRTYNRTISQILAYKNLVLNPQVFAPVGSLRQQLDDTPGAVIQYRPVAGLKPEWREMPDLPLGLFKTLEQCLMDWEDVTGQEKLPASVESGAGVVARNEREDSRRAVFISRVAAFYSRLGEQLLLLAQQHMTEPRLLEVQGRFGVELISDFKAASMRGIGSVRVQPGSIMPRTREQQQALIMNMIDKGFLDPAKAIMALNAGTIDVIVDEYELDRDKQHREIDALRKMGRMEGTGPPMVDPDADGHAVHVAELKMWMKTHDYEVQDPMVKEAAIAHLQWHEDEQNAVLMQQQVVQNAGAELQGLQNAAAPQGGGGGTPAQPKPEPSKPSVESSMRAAQGVPTRQ